MAGVSAKWKEAVLSLIVWGIVAVGGLLYFSVGHRSPRTLPSAASPASAVSASAVSAAIDFPGYFTEFDQLAGRFSEQDEFVKHLKGKKVRWRGYVSYVRSSDVSPSKIALAITPTASDDRRIALVYFNEDMRARLFALRKKDSVEITGTFDSETWDTPYIQGDTMQPVVVPAPPPAPAAVAR